MNVGYAIYAKYAKHALHAFTQKTPMPLIFFHLVHVLETWKFHGCVFCVKCVLHVFWLNQHSYSSRLCCCCKYRLCTLLLLHFKQRSGFSTCVMRLLLSNDLPGE